MARIAQIATVVVVAAVANATGQNGRSWPDWKLTRTIEVHAPTFHVQGIDFDPQRFWITSVDRVTKKGFLQEFDRTGERLRGVEIQEGDRFHPGGFASDA